MGLYVRASIIGGLVLGFVFYAVLFSPPRTFPAQFYLPVHSGETGHDIAAALKQNGAIRSEFLFRVLLRLYGQETSIAAGAYYFPEPANAFTIAWRLRVGNFNITPVKVTLPEGTDTKQMAAIFAKELPTFNSAKFLGLAKQYEGYLFPDTYFFYPGQDETHIVKTLRENFTTRTSAPATVRAIASSGRSLKDLVIMASLLEKEAPDTENRVIISGILWKRLKLGMPLQVDAVFPFITGKKGEDILQSDYSIDSPYNTYLYRGLPVGPITNPSLDAIVAAATPRATSYLYYLSDKEGNFHYSATYEGQLANQKKYLR